MLIGLLEIYQECSYTPEGYRCGVVVLVNVVRVWPSRRQQINQQRRL